MGNLIEKIALGDMELRGEVDLQITNPLTGRPYYKFQDHNMILKGMYEYMKLLCISALSSYEGFNAYRPMTSIGGDAMSSILDKVDGLCGVHNDSAYYPSGDANRAPNTDKGTFLTCPIQQVILTNGLATPAYEDCNIDGSIIAKADSRTAATSGTVLGTFSYATCLENLNKVYRRWDWPSTNGNGTLSKIYLGQRRPILPFYNRALSYSVAQALPASPFTGTYCGVAQNFAFCCTAVSSTSVTINAIKCDLATGQYSVTPITVSMAGLNTYPIGKGFYVVDDAADANVAYLLPMNVQSLYYIQVYKVNLTTLEVSVSEHCNTVSGSKSIIISSRSGYDRPCGSNGFVWAKRSTAGHITVGSYLLKLEIDVTQTEVTRLGTLTSGSESFYQYLQSPYISEELGSKGNNLYQLNFDTCGDTYLSPISYYLDSFRGDKKLFRVGDLFYQVRAYFSSTIPFTQVDVVPDILQQIYLMTERLLPEPVVKNNMPMYVGYTLNFD